MNVFTTIDQAAGAVNQVAGLVAILVGIAGALGWKKKSWVETLEKASTAAVNAAEQWRKMRTQAGDFVETDSVKQKALDKFYELVPSAKVQEAETFIEAAVKRLPKSNLDTARDEKGRFVKRE